MKNKKIFVGTVKKCENLNKYMMYGEQKYFGDFQICGIECGIMHKYVDVIEEKAVLIKISEKKYIWLVRDNNKLTDIKVIGVCPKKDNDLFVDTNTLKPYNKPIKGKTLKKNKQGPLPCGKYYTIK